MKTTPPMMISKKARLNMMSKTFSNLKRKKENLLSFRGNMYVNIRFALIEDEKFSNMLIFE